jgi:hypothetical protein
VPTGNTIHQSKPWCTEHIWDEDIKAFRLEFNALAPRVLDPNGSPDEMEVLFSEFLDRKKKQVAYIKEVTSPVVSGVWPHVRAIVHFSMPVSALNGRRSVTQIAALCYLTSRLNASKSGSTLECVLPAVSPGSLGSIKARFAELGYVEEDVKQLRWHREVSVSKPLSDRGVSHNPLSFLV